MNDTTTRSTQHKLNDLKNSFTKVFKDEPKIQEVLGKTIDFLSVYPTLPGRLLTVAKRSEKKYPQNKFFNQVSTSSDNEINEWKKSDSIFDYHLPIRGFRNEDLPSLFISQKLKDELSLTDNVAPAKVEQENILKELQARGYYDKKGNQTDKEISGKIGQKQYMDDLNLLLRYKNYDHITNEDNIDFIPSDLPQVQFEELLSKILLNEKILWKSDIKSPAPTLQIVGEGGPFDDLDDGQDSRDFKISELNYPILHPRVKTYLSLLKKILGELFKASNYSYSSIEIIPRSNSIMSIFIITDSSKKYVKQVYNKDYDTFKSIFKYTSIIAENVATHFNEDIYTPDIQFMFIDRDKSLRFQSIISKRLSRITADINSLNQLHNKNNYVFDELDFDNAFNSISQSLNRFEEKYKKHFSKNKKTVVNQEISEVFSKLDKDQKQQLITLIEEEKK